MAQELRGGGFNEAKVLGFVDNPTMRAPYRSRLTNLRERVALPFRPREVELLIAARNSLYSLYS